MRVRLGAVRRIVETAADHYRYQPGNARIALALREHLQEHRQRLHLAYRLPLRAYTVLTPSRRRWRAAELAGPAVFGTLIDLAVWLSHSRTERDGFAWRFPVHGIEGAWLSRYAPRQRFDTSVALISVPVVTESVVNRGLGLTLRGLAAEAVPLVIDHRRRSVRIPLRSTRFLAVAAIAAVGLRILGRQRARLAEDRLKAQVQAARDAGRYGAEQAITTNGGAPSLHDLLRQDILDRLSAAGRDDLVAEGHALRALRTHLEEAVAGTGGEVAHYYQLSTVLSGWAGYSADGWYFDTSSGTYGSWVERPWEPMPNVENGQAISVRPDLHFPGGRDRMRLLTGSQRLELLSVLTESAPSGISGSPRIQVRDLTPDAPVGAEVRLQFGQHIIVLTADGRDPIAAQPYDPSALGFFLEVFWAIEQWRQGYGGWSSAVTGAGSIAAAALTVGGLSPGGRVAAAVSLQALSSLPRAAVVPGGMKTDGTVAVNSVAKAKQPALLLSALWHELAPPQRLAATAAIAGITTAATIRARRFTSPAQILLEATWVVETIFPAVGLSSALRAFDAALNEIVRSAGDDARRETQVGETAAWLSRSERLLTALSGVLGDPAVVPDEAHRAALAAEMVVAGTHLEHVKQSLDARPPAR